MIPADLERTLNMIWQRQGLFGHLTLSSLRDAAVLRLRRQSGRIVATQRLPNNPTPSQVIDALQVIARSAAIKPWYQRVPNRQVTDWHRSGTVFEPYRLT